MRWSQCFPNVDSVVLSHWMTPERWVLRQNALFQAGFETLVSLECHQHYLPLYHFNLKDLLENRPIKLNTASWGSRCRLQKGDCSYTYIYIVYTATWYIGQLMQHYHR